MGGGFEGTSLEAVRPVGILEVIQVRGFRNPSEVVTKRRGGDGLSYIYEYNQ